MGSHEFTGLTSGAQPTDGVAEMYLEYMRGEFKKNNGNDPQSLKFSLVILLQVVNVIKSSFSTMWTGTLGTEMKKVFQHFNPRKRGSILLFCVFFLSLPPQLFL